MTATSPITQAELEAFTGTEHWYRHPFVCDLLYTDGIKTLAERAGAYWLIDEIALAQPAGLAEADFQSWTLSVAEDASAVLRCTDGNDAPLYRKEIPFTDFPLKRVQLFFSNHTLLLPSEW